MPVIQTIRSSSGGHDKNLLGYFQADNGTINQLVHTPRLTGGAIE
jgi:hypothetical protein